MSAEELAAMFQQNYAANLAALFIYFILKLEESEAN